MRIETADGRTVRVPGAPTEEFARQYLERITTHDAPDAVDDSREIELLGRRFPGVLEAAESEGRRP